MDPIAIHGEAVAGRQQAVRRTLVKLTDDLSKYTFDAAELLYEVQKNKYHLEWGYETLGQYAAAELNLKERRAYYLSRVVRVCTECGIARADYEPAGITKLRSIATLDPESTYFNQETQEHEPMAEHIVDLVASAPEMDTAEVDEAVAKLKGLTGENAMVTRSYSVTLSAYENTIQRCFESIRKRLGSAGRDGTGQAKEFSDGVVIECLCADWNADPRNFMEDEINVREEYGALDAMDSQEVPQEQFQKPSQPFVVSAEE